ncbi:MAG: hypothetical protein R3D02_03785 [Hyphomicrobiales bacterium]
MAGFTKAVLIWSCLIAPVAVAATENLPNSQNRDRGFLAHSLGKAERIARGCDNLYLNEAAVGSALSNAGVTLDGLIRDYEDRYMEGTDIMDRVFHSQEKGIVCDAGVRVFGEHGWLYPGFLKSK